MGQIILNKGVCAHAQLVAVLRTYQSQSDNRTTLLTQNQLQVLQSQ